MKKYIRIILFVFLFVGMTTTVVFAQGEDGTTSGGEIQTLLLPLIAAATVVERLIEVIFDYYESTVLQISKFPGLASEYVAWAQKQLRDAKDDFKDTMTPAEVSKAEQALKDAQDRIASFVKNPQYLSVKRAYAMLLGFVFGLIIAFSVEGLALFGLLGLGLPEGLTWVDKLVTGLLIGTGSAPMHSLIGLLQNTKDAVDSARALWKGEALLNAIEVQSTVDDIRLSSQSQVLLADRFMAMGDAGEGDAGAVREPIPVKPEEALSDVQLTRRAERLISK